MNLTKQFFKYVSQNIFGLLGTSCYILADTYFISQAAGTDGVTLLNLCLPVYNFIFAVGSMVGLGAATRYAILKAQGDERCQRYFSNAIFCACVLSVPFLLVGIFAPGGLLRLMGGDAGIMALGIPYARIFLMFTPFFMCNYIVSAFVRNDGDPSLAMVATLSSSLFNVVFDYIFMFPMGLGLAGAALATAVSPIISISICSRHFFKKENSVQFVRQRPSARLLGQSCQLGISGFVGEMSSGVTTTVFNLLLLGLAGNVAVAAYGVVANFALVATAIFNGVAQGAQPLVSECYGKSDKAGARKLLILGSCTALVLAAVLYFAVFPSRLDTSGSWLATAYGGQWTPEALKTELGVTTTSYLIQNGLLAVTLAPLANMIPAVGEEAGWRGYMMPRLKERLGLLNGRLLGGIIWGVWHWPLMLLVGYEYGTNYLGAPLLGLVVWCVVCFALNTLLDWLYEKTGCIWVPAIAHGALNAVASMPVVLTDPAEASYYTVLGPMPIGLIGMLPVLAVAVWLTLRQMKREEKN